MLFSKPFNINNSTFIYIDEDDSADSVFAKIELNLHPKSMTGIKFLSRIKGYEKRIYTGAYKIDAGTTTFEAFKKLESGRQTPVRLIVPSVRTMDRLASKISYCKPA